MPRSGPACTTEAIKPHPGQPIAISRHRSWAQPQLPISPDGRHHFCMCSHVQLFPSSQTHKPIVPILPHSQNDPNNPSNENENILLHHLRYNLLVFVKTRPPRPALQSPAWAFGATVILHGIFPESQTIVVHQSDQLETPCSRNLMRALRACPCPAIQSLRPLKLCLRRHPSATVTVGLGKSNLSSF
jgi:hypothetical protein